MLIDDSIKQQQTREIELELIRVRSAAEAARLESRAAELEMLLRRMARSGDVELSVLNQAEHISRDSQSLADVAPLVLPTAPANDTWSARVARMQERGEAAAVVQPSPLNALVGESPSPASSPLWKPRLPTHAAENQEDRWERVDAPTLAVPMSHIAKLATDEVEPLQADVLASAIRPPTEPKPVSIVGKGKAQPERIELTVLPTGKPSEVIAVASSQAAKPKKVLAPLPAVEAVDDEEKEETKRRFRPASWMVSTLAHVAIIVMLGVMTLANTPPKDQMAFTSSAAESNEQTMETFSIESAEPQETQPAPADTAYEISEIGSVAVTEVSMDLPPAPAAPSTSDLFSSSSSSMTSSMMKSLKGDTKAKIQFCGVDGGGNHFVYLVDSSGSMGAGFQSARTELLASIDQLKPDQRFYVVFFDEEPEYMRISDPDVKEPVSVKATAENKQRLRKWAMTVQMNKGKAPYEVLPFALSLRPDVIFLLSDGEFPTKIEDILRTQNHEENLFGESGPISIVHTIRYHGVEGETGQKAEATMVKIAKENGGQYRHVPKPKSSS